jgi:hypothetical protein
MPEPDPLLLAFGASLGVILGHFALQYGTFAVSNPFRWLLKPFKKSRWGGL